MTNIQTSGPFGAVFPPKKVMTLHSLVMLSSSSWRLSVLENVLILKKLHGSAPHCVFFVYRIPAKHLTCRNQTTVSTPNSGRRFEWLCHLVVGDFFDGFFQVERESFRLSVLAYGPRTRNLGYQHGTKMR